MDWRSTKVVDSRFESCMRDLNSEILTAIKHLAQLDVYMCAVHFDCDVSVVQTLANMSQSDLERISSQGRFLFKPIFSDATLDRLSLPGQEAQSIALATKSPRV